MRIRSSWFPSSPVSLPGNPLARCPCYTSYTSVHTCSEGRDFVSRRFYLSLSRWWISCLLPTHTITNNTVLNTLAYMSYGPVWKFPWDKCQNVELLCQRVCIYLIWLSNNRWLGRLLLPFTLPPAEHQSSCVTISMWFLLNFMHSCLVFTVMLEEETMSHTFKMAQITSPRNYLTPVIIL